MQTLRGAADKEVVDAFEGRILALSKAHSLLGRKHWETVSLRDVIDQVLQPFGLSDRRVSRFSVEGDDVHLQHLRCGIDPDLRALHKRRLRQSSVRPLLPLQRLLQL